MFATKKVKYWVKRLVPSSLTTVLSELYGVHMGGYSQKSYSHEGEDLLLHRLFGEQSSGFYVDVGAHHPVRFSNTYFFYRRGWRGINIEPNLVGIRLFNRYRSSDINLAVGVSDAPGQLSYWMFDEPALNTFDNDLAEQRLAETSYRLIGKKQVTVVSLASILNEYLRDDVQIDFMNIDAEGHDLAVLRSNDWSRFRPKWLLVESLAKDRSFEVHSDQHEFILGQGYTLSAKTLNTFFYQDRKNSC